MLDPDLEIRGGWSSRPLDKGGAQSPKKITLFHPFGLQFGLKIRGGPSPGSAIGSYSTHQITSDTQNFQFPSITFLPRTYYLLLPLGLLPLGCVGEKCVGIDWSDRHKPYITYVTFYLIVLYVYLSCVCRQNYHEDNEQESVQSKTFFETRLSACTFTFLLRESCLK